MRLDDGDGKLLVGDVIAVDVEPEALALNAAAVRKVDLEVELDAMVARSGVLLRRRRPLLLVRQS
jgi:hypothetical protein